jgi:hypothetical protein
MVVTFTLERKVVLQLAAILDACSRVRATRMPPHPERRRPPSLRAYAAAPTTATVANENHWIA